ncbi:NUDIX hydrolase [Chloroflexota bacterium]
MAENQQDDINQQLYSIADELRGQANYALQHSKNPYHRERMENVLIASARLLSIIDNRSPDDVIAEFKDHPEHFSPLLGAEAAVFKGNKLLLIKRHDDGLWAVPGGGIEIGDTLSGAALRELKEEVGLDGSIIRLLGMFDSRFWGSQLKWHLLHVIFEVSAETGTPTVTTEATDWGYFSADELPELSPGHHLRVPFLFKLMDGSVKVPYYDGPDNQRR